MVLLGFAPRMLRRLALLTSLAGLCLLAVPRVAPAATDEDEVKLGFLYNFTKFVEWPREAFASDQAPIVIGIAGDDASAAAFAEALAHKTSGGRSIVVRRVAETGDLPHCHILFLRATSRRSISDVADELSGHPVLIVGETDHFLSNGGMLNFVLRSERVRFEVNLEAAQKAKLKLSSKLVQVASPSSASRGEGR